MHLITNQLDVIVKYGLVRALQGFGPHETGETEIAAELARASDETDAEVLVTDRYD
jgi:hypothetical protein